MTDKTRAWSKRWGDKMGGMVPGLLHAGSYCGANHWLKAVKATNTLDADAVAAGHAAPAAEARSATDPPFLYLPLPRFRDASCGPPRPTHGGR